MGVIPPFISPAVARMAGVGFWAGAEASAREPQKILYAVGGQSNGIGVAEPGDGGLLENWPGAQYPTTPTGVVRQIARNPREGGLTPSGPDQSLQIMTWGTLDHWNGGGGTVSIMPTVCRDHIAAHPGDLIVIQPGCFAGTGFETLPHHWRPGETPGTGGDLYEDFVARVNTFLAANSDYVLKIIWDQGEADALASRDPADYFADILALNAAWRRDISAFDATTPVVAIRPMEEFFDNRPTSDLREVCDGMGDYLPNYFVIDVTGHTSYGANGPADDTHRDAASQELAGHRVFTALEYLETGALGPVLPSAPQGVSASPFGAGVQVTWSAPATGHPVYVEYEVERSPAGAGAWVSLVSGLAATSFVDDAASLGASYDYRVTATNHTGAGPASSVAAATTASAGVLSIVADSADDAADIADSGTRTFTGLTAQSGLAIVHVASRATTTQSIDAVRVNGVQATLLHVEDFDGSGGASARMTAAWVVNIEGVSATVEVDGTCSGGTLQRAGIQIYSLGVADQSLIEVSADGTAVSPQVGSCAGHAALTMAAGDAIVASSYVDTTNRKSVFNGGVPKVIDDSASMAGEGGAFGGFAAIEGAGQTFTPEVTITNTGGGAATSGSVRLITIKVAAS